MIFYCISNLVFSNEKQFFLIEEFLYLNLINEIQCDYIYLSNEVLRLYLKFFQNKIANMQNESNFLEIETVLENFKINNNALFKEKKRKFYDEFLLLLENNYEKYFCFCSKVKKFNEFLIKGQIISIENFVAFVHLKEKKFILESGKNFGFDYLLYNQGKGENEDFHLHAPYAVCIMKFGAKLLYYEILGKIRIAKNYKKVFFL